jgi:hypothetical protein
MEDHTHTPDEFRSFARLGFVDVYLEIAVESCLQYLKDREEYDRIVDEGGEWYEGTLVYNRMTDYIEYGHKLRKGTIKSLIFLSIFLESYINDLSGLVLGDRYSREHLDKLDLISKWIIIPRLITGTEIDKSKSFYEKLKELIKLRNMFVHHKSSDANNYLKTLNTQDFKPLKPIYESVNILAYFKMIKELFKDLDRIDKVGNHSVRIRTELNKINAINEIAN